MYSEEERAIISQYVAEHNLPKVNRDSGIVVPKVSFYTRCGKRILDVCIALPMLLITLPVNLVIGLITLFDLGRPVFFMQSRPGKDGKIIRIVKFRNMTNERDERGELLPINQRVTKLGIFMRKTSLDELLNFWSVLKGDMSIIGPRPLLTQYMDRYSDRHRMRQAVRPGLECPDIRSHGYGQGWLGRFEADVWYVENCSFLVDCKMCWYLAKMVFDVKTRKKHAEVGSGEFLGYDADGIPFGQNQVPEEYIRVLNETLAKNA